MPRLSWNEIERRAVEYSARWAGETYEKGESQSFWSEFLTVFGIDRRRHGAFFEYAIKKAGGKQGFIDLFWPGKLLAEQKSAGRDLEKATGQALDYLPAMPDYDLPQAIVVSDFATFQLRYLTTDRVISFPLEKLVDHVRAFGFLIEEDTKTLAEQDPVNRQAAERMAALHNQLESNRYLGHDLETLLARLVFCLFADDARIFERNQFANLIRNRTRDDGSDTGGWLVQLFEVLNTPYEQRQTTLDADLRAFPYINGGLFERPIRIPAFTTEMRHSLLTASLLDWRFVSPAIFGSMFQGVMNPEQRRNLGAHYTSEKNILRVIQPLVLDDLYTEFERAKRSRRSLETFHKKLATLRVLDPACGSGNFLVITYRELRRLEHKVVQELTKGQQILDLGTYLRVDVDQMYGIEIDEFASLVAQTALWLTDHQMNIEASELLGHHYVRLPLKATPHIVNANALTTDWADVVDPQELDFILGNPPFIGQHLQTKEQKQEVAAVLSGIRKTGVLDFVSAWYGKSLFMMRANPGIRAALVSTNSITQGEQVGLLWKYLFDEGMHIDFAHQTFKWTNDARGVAAVYCVIIGVSLKTPALKRLFEYPDIRGEPVEKVVKNINPYLVDAPNMWITSRRNPLSPAPRMMWGNKPVDGGFLILSDDELAELLEVEPLAKPFIRKLVGAREFLQGGSRWCLWLMEASPSQLRLMPHVLERIAKVKEVRESSVDPGARKLASRPSLFRDIRNPAQYIFIPAHSSENRDYIPIGFLTKSDIPHNSAQIIPDATLYDFGILTSQMHMAWMRTVCGRLKSDYRYSKDIVYNNFPWPEDVTDKQRADIETLAQTVLDARALYPDSSLADLYDPITMPKELTDAHHKLDRAVDRLYQRAPFATDTDRVALLFTRYQALTEY